MTWPSPVGSRIGIWSTTTDIIAIHDYDNNKQRLASRYGSEANLSDLLDHRRPGGRVLTLDGFPHQGQPVMLTEFGGIAYTSPKNTQADKAWGYVRSSNISELQMRYAALLNVVNKIEIFSGFCYTQLTDTFQEANGLLYADRTPKFPIEAIAAATLGRGREQEEVILPAAAKAG